MIIQTDISIFYIVGVFLLISALITIKMEWLTISGAIGMVMMGIIIDLAFNVWGLLIAFVFFASANLIGKIYKKDKASQHPPRNLQQVIANGGIPLLAALYTLLGGSHAFGIGCYLTSLAGATADTWASEIGALKGGIPFHIGLRQEVPSGLSGAVTLLGSVYGGMGAILIGIVSSIVYFHESVLMVFNTFMFIAIVGWSGQWIDTFLGAFLQARYRCVICETLTDQPVHCGQKAMLEHGYAWVSNNVVNGFSSILTGIIGGLVFLIYLGGV